MIKIGWTASAKFQGTISQIVGKSELQIEVQIGPSATGLELRPGKCLIKFQRGNTSETIYNTIRSQFGTEFDKLMSSKFRGVPLRITIG